MAIQMVIKCQSKGQPSAVERPDSLHRPCLVLLQQTTMHPIGACHCTITAIMECYKGDNEDWRCGEMYGND